MNALYSLTPLLPSARGWSLLGALVAALLCLTFAQPGRYQPLRRGKDFALFIAVNDYHHWSKLKHPISEVEKIAAELRSQYEFDTLILRNPTQEQIVVALRDYNARSYPDDGQVLIYLSGHGSFDNLTREGFFIPREGRLNDAAQTSYLSFSRLRDLVSSIPCNHILLAIDACYSGTFDPLIASRGDITFGRPGQPLSGRDNFIQRELTLRSRFFVASGKKEQTPDASNFAAYFLKALRNGGGDDAIVSIQELHAELINAQPKPHLSVFGDHQNESNFLFIRNMSAPIPPNTIHNARKDLADWEEAQLLDNADAYREYLRNQPHGEFRSIAKQRADSLEAKAREIAAWQNAKTLNTCDAYKNFIRDYPNSSYRLLAEEGEKKKCSTPVPSNMVFVRGGTFDMGCTSEQRDCWDNEKPVTRVTVRDFYIGRYEVTFEEYDAFCEATGRQKPSDAGWGRGRRPVILVSWYDALEYCNWLSEREGLRPVYRIDRQRKDPNNRSSYDDLKWTVTLDESANGYRLPTEAEWEYAARGGHQSKGYLYSGSNAIDEVAWYSGNSGGRTQPVGQKKANELGLHDMSGNVYEWCWDWYGAYPGGSRVDYRGPGSGFSRVSRGGSWFGDARFYRVAARSGWAPTNRNDILGFRLAL